MFFFACNGGKKKVAGGIIDETETDLQVSGILLDIERMPYSRKVVYMNEERGGEMRDSTDAKGQFAFENVKPGKWYLVVEEVSQGLLREVQVDSLDIHLDTDTLESLQSLVLLRPESGSDSLYIVQLHRTVVFESDTLILQVPRGDYEVIPADFDPAIDVMSSEALGSSAGSSVANPSSSMPVSSASTSVTTPSSSASYSSAGTSTTTLSSALNPSSSSPLPMSSMGLSATNPSSSNAVAISSASGQVALGPVTHRYLFSDLVVTLDSSANLQVLSVSSGIPMFSLGMVAFYETACITTPFLTGMIGNSSRMDARVRLKGSSSGVQGIFCNDDGSENGDRFCIRRRGLDTLEFKFQVGSALPDSLSVGDMAQNVWMTVAAEITAQKVATLYIDGVAVAQKTVDESFSGAFRTNNRIGCTNELLPKPQYFYGDIDSVTIRNL